MARVLILAAAAMVLALQPVQIMAAGNSALGASDLEKAQMLVPLIWQCMKVPDGAVDANAFAKIEIRLINGNLVGDPVILQQPKTAMERAMTRAAIQAIMSCTPYPAGISLLVDVTFDPRGLGE